MIREKQIGNEVVIDLRAKRIESTINALVLAAMLANVFRFLVVLLFGIVLLPVLPAIDLLLRVGAGITLLQVAQWATF